MGKGGDRDEEEGKEEGRREGRVREGMDGRGKVTEGMGGTGHDMGWDGEGRERERMKGGEGLQPPNFNIPGAAAEIDEKDV